ncbi:GAF domain-containing protein [Streptomyces aidingensis]|uniref:GAF domain-containing protein n=1 Tax=Streptomyces aidingensis TaxID=910347 RepID=A0A1I1H6R1_9ACTN|nr:GAF domain-containing protein [Streptomyces aidingensis]SFC17103.1 GAF domain-containing protein [Streptomyces aidingensis]
MSQSNGLTRPPDPFRQPSGAEGGDAESALLQSVVDTARAIFGARAGSVLLHDEAAGELVFQAVSGQGEDFLVGSRFPADRGLAGWVLVSGEPMIADDLRHQGMFARDVAESTGYVPDALMAAPLAHGDRVLGVLEVLDPVEQSRSSLSELDLLALFARQAAAALYVVTDRREQRERYEHAAVRAHTAAVLDPAGRARGLELVNALRELLDSPGS